MKISAMVRTPDLQTEPLALFAGPDLAASLRKAAGFGFDGVELMLKNPALLDGEGIRSLLDETGLDLAGLCSGHVFGEDGLALIGPDPDNC
jgi:sugar phosphate isomerase/epimerase